MIPFSLLWGGFSVFWEVSVLRSGAPALFRLWGIPFVLMGLYLVAGRFVVDAWLRGRTRYAVTNERVLIERSAPLPSFLALRRNLLPEMQLTETSDGCGTIRFGPSASLSGRGSFAIWTPALDQTPQFIGIADARRLFDELQSRADSSA